MNPKARLILVGHPEPTHVAAHLARAAAQLDIPHLVVDAARAYAGNAVRRRVAWWLLDRKPLRLDEFGEEIRTQVRSGQGSVVILATGIAPFSRAAVRDCRTAGAIVGNFLTDDPWNPAHRASWFLDALSEYDFVFTPRRANIPDLERLSGPTVTYVPFGFDPAVHYPDPPATPAERERFSVDVVFAGGADADRRAAVRPLAEAGFNLALYGGYWQRDRRLAPFARGMLDAAGLRKAIGGAAVSLCLVRQANRDGHAMRSFEVPAMGGCMLLEDTAEHREIFGADGDAAVYFQDEATMVQGARMLVNDPERRARLAARARQLVLDSGHTYRDRLVTMLDTMENHGTLADRAGRSGTLSRV